MCVGGHCSAESFAAAAGALIGCVNSKSWYENTASTYRQPPPHEGKIKFLPLLARPYGVFLRRIRIRVSMRMSLLKPKPGETQIQTTVVSFMTHLRYQSHQVWGWVGATVKQRIAGVRFFFFLEKSGMFATVGGLLRSVLSTPSSRASSSRFLISFPVAIATLLFRSQSTNRACFPVGESTIPSWTLFVSLSYCFSPEKVNPCIYSATRRKTSAQDYIFGSAISILIQLNEPQGTPNKIGLNRK